MTRTSNTVAKRSGLADEPKMASIVPTTDSIDALLTPQEQLFVELYFQLNFNVRMAYERAGYSARSAGVHAYTKINQIHIQAAIARHRDELRTRARLTMDDKLAILETIIRDESVSPAHRIAAIALHSKMCGDDLAAGNVDARHGIAPSPLRGLSLSELMERVNNGTAFENASVLDVHDQ